MTLFIAEIKLEKYKEAVDDCSEVLKLEEQNGKGWLVVWCTCVQCSE